MKPKHMPILIGDYTWEEMRDMLVVQLRECRSEKELVEIATAIAASIGSPKEIARVRRSLGIPPFSEADVHKLKGDTA